ncbi:UDP-N-acetylmuramoylalanyl-D-glutamate--2,6-diaminopimelate ligase [Bacillus sp. NRRL B-14911]|uniref:Uncharacterized protein n=1 Tax=Bacillus infantis NRRL B-14911 TaxID=1367477 RepID=U5L8P3_9BACI|nr:hypothetical protein N288_09170 [Bacillus infantis NRRL B-14911]EAR64882.1 UDP-N-acetylmuramoylalanyl-D-glutamate--2,6-diaminopimelate ligase [Bacillus sp. NRRL B-14911]
MQELFWLRALGKAYSCFFSYEKSSCRSAAWPTEQNGRG